MQTAIDTRPVPAASLDVVVLGGGGHVGLPLSLALAESGLRVGIYDTNQATLDGIRAGTMPFREEERTISSSGSSRRAGWHCRRIPRWWATPTS